jgi:pimeloyl-ACP methyl ester carboxylesterase
VSATVQAFERAEKRVSERYALDIATRYVELRESALRVRVLECGGGRPLLFVSGDGAVAAAWAPLLRELPGRRAVVLDRPSFGLSDRFDYRGADLRRHGVALLCGLLDALELDAVPIVGSSGGGQWSLWLALDAPQRVSALAPMGMPAVCLPGFRPRAGMRLSSAPGLGPLLFALPSPNPKTTGKMLSKADARLPDHPEVVEAYHAAMRLPGYGRSAAAIFRASMRLGGKARPAMVLSDAELARITQPVLFVWGDQEPFGDPAVARRAASQMRNASVEIVQGGWHHPWLADAPRVANLLHEFLAAHDS